VAQQGNTEGLEREKAAMALVLLMISDDEFLNSLRTNPEVALWSYGFALSPQEMELVRNLIEETRDLSDQEIRDRLEREERRRRWPW
jgi:hypothetical protein